jgi:hypothetical protein
VIIAQTIDIEMVPAKRNHLPSPGPVPTQISAPTQIVVPLDWN